MATMHDVRTHVANVPLADAMRSFADDRLSKDDHKIYFIRFTLGLSRNNKQIDTDIYQ